MDYFGNLFRKEGVLVAPLCSDQGAFLPSLFGSGLHDIHRRWVCILIPGLEGKPFASSLQNMTLESGLVSLFVKRENELSTFFVIVFALPSDREGLFYLGGDAEQKGGPVY